MRKYYIAIALISLLGLGSFSLYYTVSKDKVYDQQVLSDIQQLQEKITDYTEKNRKLPASLSDLDLEQQKVARRINNYSYKQLGRDREQGDYRYEICADFKTEKKSRESYPAETSYISSSAGHSKGRNCFTLRSYAQYDERFKP